MPPHSVTQAHYFEHNCLQQTFCLLRQEYPSLALIVQNVITTSSKRQSPDQNNKTIAVTLAATDISDIVYSLSAIGDQACQNKSQSKEQLAIIQEVLREWLSYAQHFLRDEILH